MNRISQHIEVIPAGIGAAVDSGTARLSYTITAVETPSFSQDAGTARLSYTVTAVEQAIRVYTDAATVPLTLSPTSPVFDAGTTSLTLTPSAIEVPPPVITVDAATVILLFGMAADDCFHILTPHWRIELVKRWTTVDVTRRWAITSVNSRWHTVSIGETAIDNPCPEPTFTGA